MKETILKIGASIGTGILFIILWTLFDSNVAVIAGTLCGMMTYWFIEIYDTQKQLSSKSR